MKSKTKDYNSKQQAILQHIIKNEGHILKHGLFDKQIVNEILMNTSLFSYLELLNEHYHNPKSIDDLIWRDIEGMGYGWAWIRVEEENWHNMMSKKFKDELENILFYLNQKETDVFYVMNIKDNIKSYRVIVTDKNSNDREEIVFNLSNEEIY